MTTRIMMIRATQVAIDLLVLSLAIWVAFLIRFEWVLPHQMVKRALFLWPYIVGLEYFLLLLFGVPRYVWRYVGLREAGQILLATLCATSVLILLRVVSGAVIEQWGYARYAVVPYGVIAINFLLALLGTIGVRAGRRWLSEVRLARSRRPAVMVARPTLLIGAGQAGLLVAKEIAARPEMGVLPLGFLDDDPSKKGSLLHGIPVLGPIEQVGEISQTRGATQALITIANAPGPVVRRISEFCRRAGLEVKIIPGVYELVGGNLNLSPIRSVAIDDLLRREPVALDTQAIEREFQDQCVLVTGAGGSIGSELCRQLSSFRPRLLVLVERSENALFEITRELRDRFEGQVVQACLADVGDEARMRQLLRQYAPRSIFHAAAHKHVPLMEENACEAVKNNVAGTMNLAQLAHQARVESFVMISTDKAVRPSSVMGATKRAAEIYIQALSQTSATRFVTVRFGNVLGSAGSVVPIFQEQIARGGPITVTHPDVKRYFMTIPEATQLVLQAATMGDGGEIFVLDMGEPIRIVDLARDLIRLSGFDVQDLPIVYTGLRPGEKLFEELSTSEESVAKTQHPKVFVGRTTAEPLRVIMPLIEALIAEGQRGDESAARKALNALVEDYRAPERVPAFQPTPAERALPGALVKPSSVAG